MIELTPQPASGATSRAGSASLPEVQASARTIDDSERPATVEHGAAAAGFVDALVQLPGYAPSDTTFAFVRSRLAADAFLQAMEAELAGRGYGLRLPTTLDHPDDVEHAAERDMNGGTTRTVSFGPVQMRRRFVQLPDGQWTASGSLFIRGADASRVTLREDGQRPAAARLPGIADASGLASVVARRGSSGDRPGVAAPQIAAPQVVASQVAEPSIADVPATDDVVVRGAERPVAARIEAATRGSPGARSGAPPVTADLPGLASPVPENIAALGYSNYAGLFENHTDIEELVLVFADDSMVLGVDNKRAIQQAVARVDPQRDLFSIIGCSFGKTAIENGNEVLATGRAHRVKEALMFAGVAGERILDEGCWAGAPAEDFPGRGVLLTIKRPGGSVGDAAGNAAADALDDASGSTAR